MFDLAVKIAVEQGLVESGDDIVIKLQVYHSGEAVRTNTQCASALYANLT